MPSLLEALERKYCLDCQLKDDVVIDDDDSPQTELQFSIFIPNESPLMLVPELLVLNDCEIDCAGDFETIKEKLRRVRELDLAQNKLQDWKEVFRILKHMPRIEFLNLSKNRLMGPITKLSAPSISNLRSMVLNGTYLDWLCINVLLENLPVLEELHLSLNNYKEVLIDTAATDTEYTHNDKTLMCENCNNLNTAYSTDSESNENNDRKVKKVSEHNALKTLHFTGNPIESWLEICRLGRVFPCLENLFLADCKIKSIQPDGYKCNTADTQTPNFDEDESYKHFPRLSFLNLSYAKLGTWEDIDLLAKFPKLNRLRIKSIPLWDKLECTEHERRQLLIARLPNISELNGGGAIKHDEREDSERAFIRHYMEKSESERPSRYNELIAKHGELDPLVNINLKPDKHAKVYLTYKDQRELRNVDINRTVADLKVCLGKVVGLPANKMRLYYLDKDYKDFGPEEMRFPNKLLYSYNIQSEDEIIIEEKH